MPGESETKKLIDLIIMVEENGRINCKMPLPMGRVKVNSPEKT